jgi:hypothetical protein
MMRVLPVALLFSLPLFAHDPDTLGDAVGRFGSDDPEVREAASRTVRTHLEQTLAPVLEAMQSKDPEVRRRAHDAVASLLPYEVESPKFEGQDLGVLLGQARGRGRLPVQIVVQGVRGGRGRVRVVGAVSGEEAATLNSFGMGGGAIRERFVRRQLRLAQGRGYLVTKVMKDTSAKELGLELDDIILRVNGEPAMQPDTVARLLGEPSGWQDVRIRVLRDGALVDLPGR